MTPEETVRQIASSSGYGKVALWVGLAAGITLILGFFVPLPIPILLLALLVVITAAVVLTFDQTRAQPGQPKAEVGRVRRFLGWLFLLLP